jgi:hypothetical protein
LVLPTFLRTIEATGLSIWLRESPSLLAYPAVITIHTFGMVLLAGPSLAIDLRILGVARSLSLAPLGRYFPVMWLGFWMNALTGVLLVVAYPTKAFTDPIFYFKLACIVTAAICMRMIYRRVFRADSSNGESLAAASRNLAAISMFCWLGAIAAGKFIEYTYRYLVYPAA